MTDTNEKAQAAPKPKEESAKLKRTHRHRGELKHEGDTIKGRTQTIARLREQGIVA